MFKNIVLFTFLFTAWHKGLGQDLTSMTWVGFQGETHVFSHYYDGYRDLYILNEENLIFSFFEKNRVQPKYKDYYVGYYYVEDDFRRYSVRKTNDSFPFALELNGDFEIIEIPFNPQGTGYDIKNKTIYLGNQSDNPDLHLSLPMHQLNLETGELTEVSINGVNPVVIGNYLFYADYPNPKQFDLVYDIYLVKIGDWNNSEKVFEQNYMSNWKVSSDGRYLLAEIIESGYKPQKIIHDLFNNKYSIVDREDFPRAVFYSKNKKAFCFYDIGLKNGQRRFIYIPIPKEFPYTPDWAMDFGESFINNYLLEKADEDTLRSLNKAQLRLLRNAIFARRGWRFNDPELSDFFKQFEWYNYQTNLYKNNSEIKLTNSDKWRIKVIQSVEEVK